MAPLSKKAKTAPPAPGSGLGKFFGSGKNAGGDSAKIGAAPVLGTPAPAFATQAPTPVAPHTPAQPSVQSSSGGLTEAQKLLIAENRRKALERKQAGSLTEAQNLLIQENRRKALERKQARENGQEVPKSALPVVAAPKPVPPVVAAPRVNNSFDNADNYDNFDNDDCDMDRQNDNDGPDDGLRGHDEPSPAKPPASKQTLKREGSDITPEKTAAPKEKRRPVQESAARVLATTAAAPEVWKPKNAEDQFKSFGKVPWVQYSTLYGLRLDKLRPSVLAHAKSLWSGEVPAENFYTTIDTNKMGSASDVVFVGATYKEMPSRNNVIEQYRDCNVASSCLPEDDVDKQPNLCSDADVMWLEDGTFRIQLLLKAEQAAKFATGFIMAVRGSITSDGKFEAKDFCLAQNFALTPLPASVPAKRAAPGPYIALVSGLFIGAPDEDIKARNRAVDFLLGQSEAKNLQKLAKSVQHVIVCGGVYGVGKMAEVPAGLEEADNMFAKLAEKLPVDVMPGHKDPSNLSLPQMPLHPFFFRSAQKCSKFKSVSNPHQRTVGDLQILGHAGQPLRDLMRCTSITSPMEALTTCLDASLLAPTAPDTLVTQSFNGADPFVIEKPPQVLFSAGHDKVEYEWRAPASGNSGTLCVCVPAFNKQPCIVLVNLKDPRDVIVQDFGAK